MAGRALRIEVDIGAIRANARAVMRAIGPQVCLYACLKGDAYGLGVRHAVPALLQEGVREFAAGSLEDGLAIRAAGAPGAILVYPNCLPDAAPAVHAAGLTVTLSSVEEARAWDAAARAVLPVFVKVDAGALRAGVLPRAAADLARTLRDLQHVRVMGVLAHLQLADPVAMRMQARREFAAFVEAAAAIAAAGVPVPVRMVAGTAVLQQFPEMDLEAVDPGRALFGLGFPAATRALALRPALSRFSARLLLVKDVLPGDLASNAVAAAWRGVSRIGLLPLGWGDGLARRMPPCASVLVRGRRVRLLPPSHFEHVRVDLSAVPDASYGDEVVIVGRQAAEEITLAEAAAWAGKDELHYLGTLPRHIERVPVHH